MTCLCINGKRNWRCRWPHRGTQRYRRSMRPSRRARRSDFCCGGEFFDWLDQRIKWRKRREDLRSEATP